MDKKGGIEHPGLLGSVKHGLFMRQENDRQKERGEGRALGDLGSNGLNMLI